MKKISYSPSNNLVLFDSQNLEFKNPFGAVPCNEQITLTIHIHKSVLCKGVNLFLIKDNKNNINNSKIKIIPLKRSDLSKNYEIWSVKFNTPKFPKLLFYYFEINGKNKFFYGNNNLNLGGIGDIYFNNPKLFQITTYYKDSFTPRWFKNSIAYQIFPDRFFNDNYNSCIKNPKKNSFIYGHWDDIPLYIRGENQNILRWDFFGGTLNGISKKIPYLKSININLIYLNPIFKATSNHRYDTGDYLTIDPILGSNNDFNHLIKNCKNENINIILDGVFNHTGKDSIYFNRNNTYDSIGAYNSKNSPYYSWYKFKKFPNSYESWWGIHDLPTVNELDPNFLDFIIEGKDSVTNHWLSKGIMGWRLDVADELPSYFIEKLKYKCKELNDESILIGEVWEDASNKLSYNQRREYFSGLQLDSVMNYPLREYLLNFLNFSIDSSTLCMFMKSLQENYPKENYFSLFNLLSSHDVKRIKTAVIDILPSPTDKDKLQITLKSLSLIQFTLPGVPVIYYGDEVGLEGDKDPDNRRTYPWGNEDLDLLKWYKKITSFRSDYSLLIQGEVLFFSPHIDIFAYFRYSKDKNNFILVMWNRSNKNILNFSFNLKDFLPIYSKNIASNIYQWNAPLNIPLDFSTDFLIKIPPLETLLFYNKNV